MTTYKLNDIFEGFINRQKSDDSINPDKKDIFSGNSSEIVLKKTDDLNNLADQLENIFKYIPVLKDRIKIDRFYINYGYLYLYFYVNKVFYFRVSFYNKDKVFPEKYISFAEFSFIFGNMIDRGENMSYVNSSFEIGYINDNDYINFIYNIITPPLFSYKNKNIFLKGTINKFIKWMIELILANKDNQLFNKLTDELNEVFFKADNSKEFKRFLQDQNMKADFYALNNLKYNIMYYFLRIFYKDNVRIDKKITAENIKTVKDFLREFTDINPDLLNEGFINKSKNDITAGPNNIFKDNNISIDLRNINKSIYIKDFRKILFDNLEKFNINTNTPTSEHPGGMFLKDTDTDELFNVFTLDVFTKNISEFEMSMSSFPNKLINNKKNYCKLNIPFKREIDLENNKFLEFYFGNKINMYLGFLRRLFDIDYYSMYDFTELYNFDIDIQPEFSGKPVNDINAMSQFIAFCKYIQSDEFNERNIYFHKLMNKIQVDLNLPGIENVLKCVYKYYFQKITEPYFFSNIPKDYNTDIKPEMENNIKKYINDNVK